MKIVITCGECGLDHEPNTLGGRPITEPDLRTLCIDCLRLALGYKQMYTWTRTGFWYKPWTWRNGYWRHAWNEEYAKLRVLQQKAIRAAKAA